MSDLRDFERSFGSVGGGSLVEARAPGRVNLIGEHTDYSGGFVLPMAIPQTTQVLLARRAGRRVRAASTLGEASITTFELGSEAKRGTWIDYVQGTIVALRARGFEVEGFDVSVSSNVPIGSGLSSSAALEVSLLRALRKAFELDLDDLTIAKVGRAAETDFVGAPIGIMDQMASSFADATNALFIDTRSLAYERVALPRGVEIVVIDSGIRHDHATGGYSERRAEVEEATTLLGVELLRDVEDPVVTASLPQPLSRRARHVVTENTRVLAAVACMRTDDIEQLGQLLDASHASLRDDFEVSVPDVDRLVALAQRDEDLLGARMTGGGFGGAIVALAKEGRGGDAARRVAREYGGAAKILVPEER